MGLMWIFYIANVVDNFNGGIAVIIYLLAFLLLTGFLFLNVLVADCDDDDYEKSGMKRIIKMIKPFAIFFITLAVLLNFIPSSNTIYLMAGTEQIEKLSTTEEGQKVKQALDLGLDKVIKNLKEGK